MTTLDHYLPRIRTMHPHMTVQSARLNTDGAQNDVVIVASDDGNWIFRFTKNDPARAALDRELRLLDAVKLHMPIPVPDPVIRESDAMAYRMLEGEPLTAWLIASLDESTQQRLADQLGGFLRTLHGMSPGLLPERERQAGGEGFRELHMRLREKLYPFFDPHQREWTDRLFADGDGIYDNLPQEHASRLIHNDLKIGHVLYDARTRQLSGVLDFGIACYDPPDIDICNLLQCFGETFVTRMFNAYPDACALLPRARFAVHVMELEALYDGLVSNNPHRLVANIAVPRDVAFPIFQPERPR